VVDHLATIVVVGVLVPLAFGAGPDGPAPGAGGFDPARLGPGFLAAVLLGGQACTVLGAFVGARRARVYPLRHGGWVAVVSAAIGVVLYTLPASGPVPPVPVWYDLLSWFLVIPSGLLGGALARAVSVDAD